MNLYVPYHNVITPEQFGAGQTGTTDKEAFDLMNTALLVDNTRTVMVQGTYTFTDGEDWDIPDGTKVLGNAVFNLSDNSRIVPGSNTHVEGITIDGSGDSGSIYGAAIQISIQSYVTIKDVTITNATDIGIQIRVSDNITISGCKILDAFRSGIYLREGANQVTIEDCYILNCAASSAIDCGIKVVGNFGGPILPNDDLIIKNNRIENCGRLGVEAYVNSSTLEVTSNVVRNYQYADGIGLSIVSASGGIVAHNKIINDTGNTAYAIEIAFCDNLAVNSNTITGADIGISFNNTPDSNACTVSNNTLIDCVDEGIRIKGDDNIINNNIVKNCGGICLYDFGGNNNLYTGNVVSSTGASDGVGFKGAAIDSIVQNNIMTTPNATNTISITAGSSIIGKNRTDGAVLETGTGTLHYYDGTRVNVDETITLADIKGTMLNRENRDSVDPGGAGLRKYLTFASTTGSTTKTINIKHLVIANETDNAPGIIQIDWVGRNSNSSSGGTLWMYRHVFDDFDAAFVTAQIGTALTLDYVIDGSGYPFWEIVLPVNGRCEVFVTISGAMAGSDKWTIYYDETDDIP